MSLTAEKLYSKWDKGITGMIIKAGVPFREVEDVKQQVYMEFVRGQVFGLCPNCGKEIVCNNDSYDEYLEECKQREEAGSEKLQVVIYCRVCAKAGKKVVLENVQRRSYDKIFDENLGGESTFIYHFVRRRCMQFISKTYRDPLCQSSRGKSMEENIGLDLLDIIPDTKQEVSEDVDLSMAVDRLKAKLEDVPIKDIVESLNLERSLRKVFEFIERGYKQRQIAARLNYSEPTVSLMVKEIRRIAGELGLQDIFKDRTYVKTRDCFTVTDARLVAKENKARYLAEDHSNFERSHNVYEVESEVESEVGSELEGFCAEESCMEKCDADINE